MKVQYYTSNMQWLEVNMGPCYNAGIVVRERRICYFKLDNFNTEESQQITKIITTQIDAQTFLIKTPTQ